MTQVLMPTLQQNGRGMQAPPVLTAQKWDAEAILPIALIRQHTKTDDVQRVPDSLIVLYRDAALRAAEQYTGMLLREQRIVTQDASHPRDLTAGHRWKSHVTMKLEFPTADGIVYLYGGKHSIAVTTIVTQPGATKIKMPVDHYALDMTPCCGNPCGNPANAGMSLMYRAGISCIEDIPPAIQMGCLKYLAWQMNNPGDDALANVNLANVNPQASRNNAAWQSGAIEEWRSCVRDAL